MCTYVEKQNKEIQEIKKLHQQPLCFIKHLIYMHYVNSAMTKKPTFSDKVSQAAVIVTIHTALKNVKKYCTITS